MTWGAYTSLFNEATEFALTLFHGSKDSTGNGWDDITEPMSVAHAVVLLAAEYRESMSEGRGMNSEEVKHCVQIILDAARFDPENRPYEYDPKAQEKPSDPDLRVFAFRTAGRGRPAGREYEDHAISYIIGAVVGRFDLRLYPKPSSRLGQKDRRPSAIEVVAEAQRQRKRRPMSVEGVRKAFERPSPLGTGINSEAYLVGRSEGEEAKLEISRQENT